MRIMLKNISTPLSITSPNIYILSSTGGNYTCIPNNFLSSYLLAVTATLPVGSVLQSQTKEVSRYHRNTANKKITCCLFTPNSLHVFSNISDQQFHQKPKVSNKFIYQGFIWIIFGCLVRITTPFSTILY